MSQSCCAGKSYGAQVNWMDSTPEEIDLWRRMMESPSEWIEGVLPLRMLTTDNKAWKMSLQWEAFTIIEVQLSYFCTFHSLRFL